jgi:glucokinase
MKEAIGIDIGGTNTKAALVSESGAILERSSMHTPTSSLGELKSTVFALIEKLMNQNVVAIGFGVAGILDKNKMVTESPNVSILRGVNLKTECEIQFSLPAIVENDANAYAYAEKWVGAGVDIEHFALITLGTGIGGGIIYKNELFECAAEIGHMVVEPEGNICNCGAVGCFEAHASGWALVNQVFNQLKDSQKTILYETCQGNFYRLTPEMIYQAALAGDTFSRGVFRDMGRYLGIGLSSLINILGPEAIILGGGLAGGWDLFIKEIDREISRRAIKSLAKNVRILRSMLTAEGGALGAAGLALKRHG